MIYVKYHPQTRVLGWGWLQGEHNIGRLLEGYGMGIYNRQWELNY